MRDRIPPGPGQESCWDYPRPPALEPSPRLVRVMHGQHTIAETRQAYRVLETSHPPTWYLPPESIDMSALQPSRMTSACEWKGHARYFDLMRDGARIEQVGWSYPQPTQRFAAIAGYVAFYGSKLTCFVDDEPVTSQPGDFYGGWITSDVVGPFKGGRGTWGW